MLRSLQRLLYFQNPFIRPQKKKCKNHLSLSLLSAPQAIICKTHESLMNHGLERTVLTQSRSCAENMWFLWKIEKERLVWCSRVLGAGDRSTVFSTQPLSLCFWHTTEPDLALLLLSSHSSLHGNANLPRCPVCPHSQPPTTRQAFLCLAIYQPPNARQHQPVHSCTPGFVSGCSLWNVPL